MRYFLDTEFIESGAWAPIHLISIGIVAEDGREFYAINSDCPLADANDWVRENVFPYLTAQGSDHMPLRMIAQEVQRFCRAGTGETPEFWGYYADYDWVVFCQMFGTMIQLPKGWPMYCRDIKQWCDQLGNPKLPPQESVAHNALNDARWNRTAWNYLRTTDLERSARSKPKESLS